MKKYNKKTLENVETAKVVYSNGDYDFFDGISFGWIDYYLNNAKKDASVLVDPMYKNESRREDQTLCYFDMFLEIINDPKNKVIINAKVPVALQGKKVRAHKIARKTTARKTTARKTTTRRHTMKGTSVRAVNKITIDNIKNATNCRGYVGNKMIEIYRLDRGYWHLISTWQNSFGEYNSNESVYDDAGLVRYVNGVMSAKSPKSAEFDFNNQVIVVKRD